jgi:hypothetical protein
MRRRFLVSISILFMSTSLVIAQDSTTSDEAPAKQAGLAAAQDDLTPPSSNPKGNVLPPPKSVDPGQFPPPASVSPYWPNPAAKACYDASQAPILPKSLCGQAGDYLWFDMEYLLWWVKKGPEPQPLVTTSSLGSLGILGASDTFVVTGGTAIDYQAFSGMRMSGGCFFNDDHAFGLEIGGFFTEHRPFGTNDVSAGSPLLARPIINAQTGLEAAELVSAPGVAAGSILIGSTSSLSGYDMNALTSLWRDGPSRLVLLAGFRYLTLTEDLTISQATILLPGGTAGFNDQVIGVPTNVGIFDKFGVDNNFYGGQVGAKWEYLSGNFFANGLIKLAIGGVHEDINIGGSSSTSGGGTTPRSTAGGLLALASNSGHANHDDFAFVPELGVNLGYQFTPVFRAYVGYTFLWWSDVARPGDLINRNINPSLVPTSTTFGTNNVPAEPSRSIHQTDFWAQGVNFGVEFRY